MARQARKIFTSRNSLLTDLFKNEHIRTIYNAAVSFFIIFVIRTVVVDLFEKGYIDFSFNLIISSFHKLDLAIKACLIMFASLTLGFYPMFHSWAGRRDPAESDAVDKIMLIVCFGFLMGLLILPPVFVICNDLAKASTFVVLCEQIRLIMKVHSFTRENVPKVLDFRLTKSKLSLKHDSTQEIEDTNPCPPFSNFLYFLFAPTLIYRDSYPMTPKTRWCEVVKSLLQIVLCLLAVHYIFATTIFSHFCVTEFQHFNVQHVSFKEFVLSWFKSIIPASACFLIMFFLVLHSWHNVTAEILRFGDRLFYEDWWTAHNLSTYYRKWNVIVHDWLHDYVYNDAVQVLGSKPALAAVVVFNLSAVFHEYLVILAFRFFYPVLFVQFFFVSVPILFLTKCLKSGQFFANSLFWLIITTGTGLSLSLYAMEYYARQNCQPTFDNKILDLFVPRLSELMMLIN